MKRIITLVILISMMLLCACSAGSSTASEKAPSIHWRKDTTGKYLNDDSVVSNCPIKIFQADYSVFKVQKFEIKTQKEKNKVLLTPLSYYDVGVKSIP